MGAAVTVYVDEYRRWGVGRVPRCFRAGSCHLTADTTEELHVFAKRIGLKRSWFQDHPLHPHYDLTAKKRHAAILRGAVFAPARWQARRRLGLPQREDTISLEDDFCCSCAQPWPGSLTEHDEEHFCPVCLPVARQAC